MRYGKSKVEWIQNIHGNSHTPLENKGGMNSKVVWEIQRGVRFPKPHGFSNDSPYFQLEKRCMAPNCLSLFVNVGTFFESANVGSGLADITEFAAKPGLGGSFTVGSILEGGWTEVGGLVGIIGQLCSLFI